MRVALIVVGLVLAVTGWGQPQLRLETGIGHTSRLTTAIFSPNGKSVLTASDDNTARLWDVPSGKEIRRFEAHGGPLTSAIFSADGKSILTASWDRTARLWDVASGKEIRRFEGHEDSVRSAVFSPDGKSILTASHDKTACLWDVASGKETLRFEGHGGPVWRAIFSPDGRSALTASEDNTARLWDVASGRETRRFEGHGGGLTRAVFSPDGMGVLIASGDNTARLCDIASGKETRRFEGHGSYVRSADFSSDGKSVLTASDDKTARLWDVAAGKEIRRFEGHGDYVMSAIYSPDGRNVLTASEDQTARLWDVGTGTETRRFEGHRGTVLSATFSPDSMNVLTSSWDNTARLWDVASGKEIRRFEGHGGTVWSAIFSADDKCVLTASRDDTAKLWDVASGKEIRRLDGHGGQVFSAIFSAAGTRVLTASADGTSRLWDVATGREARRFEGHGDWVWSAAFAPDSKSVLTASGDNTARLWDIASGKEIRRFDGHGGQVFSAIFSAAGTSVLTASDDGSARLWDVATGNETRRFVGHEGPVSSANFSPNGKSVITASSDKTARMWNVATGKETWRLEGHGASVRSATFSPDDKSVLTASDDKTARLWDVSTGKETRRFEGHRGPVSSAIFSSEGTSVVTASADGTSRIWDTGTGKELCALISYRDGSWAVVDPEGRYDSSNGGQNPNLYWVYEDPAKGILDTVGVDQIGSYFYTPGLLAKCMKREKLPQVENLDKLPIFPKVDDLTINKTKATFTLTDRGGGIGQVKAFVDGQLVKTIQGKSGKNTLELEAEGQDIQIIAYNGKNSLASPRSTSTSPPPVNVTTPTRYVAVIAGIETYAGPGLKPLNYAADDAVAIARSVLACAKGLKITPDIYVLSSAPEAQDLKKEGITVLPATKAAFKDVFTKILPAGGKWRDSDLMFLYFSGHGGSYKEGNLSHYAYYTEDARDADLSIKRDEWAVTDVELVEWLAKFPGGKRAMILDTCAAGAATELLAQAKDDADRERAMLDTNRNTGMSVLFGSAESAASWESNGHGLLTYSILQALATQQDLGEGLKDAVRVDTLFSRAEGDTRKEAERLGLKQEPRKFGRGQNFPIGFLDDAGRKAIPYQSPVPLFGKPSLINSATGLDDLDLMAQLGDALRRSSQPKAGEPLPLRYVPDSPAAVQIQGAYTVSGDRVTVIMNLLEKGKATVPIKVEATKQDLVDAAVRAIITWARGKAK